MSTVEDFKKKLDGMRKVESVMVDQAIFAKVIANYQDKIVAVSKIGLDAKEIDSRLRNATAKELGLSEKDASSIFGVYDQRMAELREEMVSNLIKRV